MAFAKKKLITIICEAQLEKNLIEDLEGFKIGGYTICEAKGYGSKGLRAADWEQNRNIRVEIVCGPQDGENIMLHLKKEYYEDYAMISYMSDVDVIRAEKFEDH